MYAPIDVPEPTPAPTPAPPDPYTTSVMSYADKVKQLLAQRAAPADTTASPPAGPPVTGTLPGTPPENPNKDNMTINARSGEYVFPEPAVKYYGVKKLEDMVHKAIEDINPPGQPAPEPPTQAQTFARGGLINRKHFLRLPKGHAYDKMSPKKNPMKMPVGMPAPPDAMDPSAMQVAPQQMGPPAQPTQPPLPGYWGGGIVHNNPDYWQGRNWSDWSDSYSGPQVQVFGGRNIWDPNSSQYQPFPDFDQINRQMSGTEWKPQGGSPHFPRRQNRYMGGMVEPEGYYRGGEIGPRVQIGRDPNYGLGGFAPRSLSEVYTPHDLGSTGWHNLWGATNSIYPPGPSLGGPTQNPSNWTWQGGQFGWTPVGQLAGPSDANTNPGYLHHSGLQRKST